jgi:magnesium transporter
MDENLSGRQKLQLVSKEARVGFCNGLLLGMLSFVLIGLYLFLLVGEAPGLAFSVSFCTGIALMLSMLLSSVSGTTIPMLFKKLKIDPAVASGPFITTINDLVAVVTYYGLAWIMLISVMQV